MLRYIWKQCFDDRIVWSAMLSLVSKGLARIQTDDSVAILKPIHRARVDGSLSPEEQVIFRELLSHRRTKGMMLNMLDGPFAIVVSRMADILRSNAEGRWFHPNRESVRTGFALSVIAVAIVAMPQRPDEAFALVASLAFMVPGGFYVVLLALRLGDLYKAGQKALDGAIARRAAMLGILLIACLSSLLIGFVVLGVNFGWPLIAVAVLLAGLNLAFLHFMKAPTTEGRVLLDRIEGFRLFLKSVERLPMDRSESPGGVPGVYEKYLPYALALEVEQAWCDRFIAMASSHHERQEMLGAESIYLGMWNGKPVEVVYKPPRVRGTGGY